MSRVKGKQPLVIFPSFILSHFPLTGKAEKYFFNVKKRDTSFKEIDGKKISF